MKYTSLSLKFTGSSEIKIYYAVSKSNTTHPDFKNIGTLNDEHGNYGLDTWYYNKIPNWRGAKGTYVWQRTSTEFSDGRTENIAACLEIRQAAELVVQTYQANDTNQNNANLKNIYYEDIADWCGKTGTTIISGSEIFTNSITSEHLTSNALKSENYNPGAANTLIPQDIYPLAGSYFDFKQGNFYSPSFVVRSNDNQAYFKGNVTADSGTIGAWDIYSQGYLGSAHSRDGVLYGIAIDPTKAAFDQNSRVFGIGAMPNGVPGAWDQCGFYIRADGSMTAKNANIEGILKAGDQSQIGSFKVNGETLQTLNSQVSFNEGGITTNDITVKQNLSTEVFKAKQISGMRSNSAILYMDKDANTYSNYNIYIRSYSQQNREYVFYATSEVEILKGATISLAVYYQYYTTDGLLQGEHIEYPTLTFQGGSKESSKTYQYPSKKPGSLSLPFHHVVVTSVKIGDENIAFNSSNITLGETKTIASFSQQDGSSEPVIQFKGHFIPETGATYDLGHKDFRWRNIYYATGAHESSDKNLKNSIMPLSSVYENVFDKLLPVSYKFKDGTSDRTHIGFIAQEVEQALLESDLTTKDFAGVSYWDQEDGTKGYGLRYTEFIPLNTHEIQKLKKRATEQDQKILELEEKLSNLEKLIQTNGN